MKIDCDAVVLCNGRRLELDECEGVLIKDGVPVEYHARRYAYRYIIPREAVAYFSRKEQED